MSLMTLGDPSTTSTKNIDETPTQVTPPAASAAEAQVEHINLKDSNHTNHVPSGGLMRLARVEIQAIMKFLPRVDLLHLCRCSRTLLADGDSDVVWSTQPVYEFDLQDLGYLMYGNSGFEHRNDLGNSDFFSTPSLFIRRQSEFGLSGHARRYEFLLKVLDTIPRLRRWTIPEQATFTASQWECILEHPGLNNLTSLDIQCQCTLLKASTFLLHIKELVNLTALTLPRRMKKYDSVVGLRTFPRLQFLNILEDAELPNLEVSILTSINHCEHLTRLHLTRPLLKPDRFQAIFSSPNLSKLRELSFTNWVWYNGYGPKEAATFYPMDDPASFDLIRATWSSLTCLERLIMKEIPRINFLLPTLTCGHLKQLIFDLPNPTTNFMIPDSNPTADRLDELLVRHQDLHITISVLGEFYGRIYDSLRSNHPNRFQTLLRSRSPNL